jgi:4-aminobutyrate aminotransferase-like enzyme
MTIQTPPPGAPLMGASSQEVGLAGIDARQEGLIRHTFIDFKQTSDFLNRPLVFERADGLYVWDQDGRKYFDAIGGIFVAVLGHRHPRVIEAVRHQLDRMTFAPPLHGTTDIALDFIEKLASVTPGNLNYIKGFSGGSESVEAAMKFARQYFKQTGHPDKHKFIGNYLSYHGSTQGAMAAGGGAHRKVKFQPEPSGYLKIPSPIQLRDRFPTWEETNRFCAQLYEDVIVSESPDTIAGVILEPVCNTGGMVTPTAEYFAMIRDICTRHDVLLIFDEVLTGFGKTGDMFAAQTYGVTPDIICGGRHRHARRARRGRLRGPGAPARRSHASPAGGPQVHRRRPRGPRPWGPAGRRAGPGRHDQRAISGRSEARGGPPHGGARQRPDPADRSGLVRGLPAAHRRG